MVDALLYTRERLGPDYRPIEPALAALPADKKARARDDASPGEYRRAHAQRTCAPFERLARTVTRLLLCRST